jgi:hypothetical protein
LQKRRPGELLCIGKDFYIGKKEAGTFPLGYITAEGYVWKSLVNPRGLGFDAWINALAKIKGVKENIKSPFKTFRDESLIHYFLSGWKGARRELPLGYVMFDDVLHRNKGMDADKLKKGGYVEAHHLIPVDKCRDKITAIEQYLKERI